MPVSIKSSDTQRINILALGIAASVTLALIYVVCAVVAMAVPSLAFAHVWLTLFSAAPIGSVQGLVEGTIWSVVAGWVAAVILGWVYNRVAGKRSVTG